jgi:hypothetical protein
MGFYNISDMHSADRRIWKYFSQILKDQIEDLEEHEKILFVKKNSNLVKRLIIDNNNENIYLKEFSNSK